MLFRVLFLVIFFILILQNTVNTQWVEPDAWSRSRAQLNDIIETGVCPTCSCEGKYESTNDNLNNRAADNAAAAIYYSKLLKFMFSRHKMAAPDNEDGMYSRSIKFSFTSQQMDILENSNDPRDWDAVLSEAFPQFQTLAGTTSGNSWISSIFYYLGTLSLPSEGMFTLIIIIVSGYIFVTHRGNKWGMISTALMGSFIFGFVHTYYDCNRKLEVEKLMDLMVNDEDPCELMKQSKQLGFWASLFSRSVTKEQCIEHLKKKHKIQLPFCRPDKVFLSFLNEMVFNQLTLIVELLMNIFENINVKYSFPEKICAFLFLGLFLPLFFKLLFKYILSPSNWYGRGRKNTDDSTRSTQDSLSGENLRTFLLSVKNTTEVTKNQILKLESSGVEEILAVVPPMMQIEGSSTKNYSESVALSSSSLPSDKEEAITNLEEHLDSDKAGVEKNVNTETKEMHGNLEEHLAKTSETDKKAT